MKKVVILVVATIVMAACGGGSSSEFASVGKKVDMEMGEKYANYTGDYYEDGKIGYVVENKIAVPPIFDAIKYVIERNDWETVDSEYVIVVKGGKEGLVKMFQKKYIVPCDYEMISVIPSKNFLFLQKEGEDIETHLLDPLKGWMGTGVWPPKKFPAEVPFKLLCDPVYWKIVSLKCTGRGTREVRITTTSYEFELEIECVKDSRMRATKSMSIDEYNKFDRFFVCIDENGNINQDLTVWDSDFPKAEEGRIYKLHFSLSDEKIRDINFTGFLIDKKYK